MWNLVSLTFESYLIQSGQRFGKRTPHCRTFLYVRTFEAFPGTAPPTPQPTRSSTACILHHLASSCIILHHLALSCVICVNRICRSCWSLAASSVGIRPPGITANSLCDFRGTKGINRVQVWSGMYRLRKYGEIRRVRVQCRVQPGATDDLFVRFCATNSWYLVMLVLPSYTSMYQLAFATTCQLLPLRSFE